MNQIVWLDGCCTINNILASLPQISGKLSFLFKYSNQRVHARCEENLLCHTTTRSLPGDVSKICAIPQPGVYARCAQNLVPEQNLRGRTCKGNLLCHTTTPPPSKPSPQPSPSPARIINLPPPDTNGAALHPSTPGCISLHCTALKCNEM